MSMQGRTQCAVRGCTNPPSGPCNLCGLHRVPGAIVRLGESTMVITSWLVQHGQEEGILIINDFALGDVFCGVDGFLAKLQEQEFTNVRNLAAPEELEAARSTTLASWSGSWQALYPWHGLKKERAISDLRAIVLSDVAGDEGDALMALVFRDDVRLTFPDGAAHTLLINDRLETSASVDALIALAEKSMRAYCSTVTPEAPHLTVHRLPDGLDEDAARKWLESLPGIELVDHPERRKRCGGPIPPAGRGG